MTTPAIKSGAKKHRASLLLTELEWLVQLRWLAGLSVILGAIVDMKWIGWSETPRGLLAIGVAILAYNIILWRLNAIEARRPTRLRRMLLALAASQVLLDLAALTIICLWTGGPLSPFVGFFVFHMVFASLLLSTRLAYAVAATAALLMGGILSITARWPHELDALLRMGVLLFTLLFTVHLANHLTRALRRQRIKLRRRNHRIQAMSQALHAQQLAMAQHEKMVALGHMAAGVTHEITNPLASMDSLLQLMLRNAQRMTTENLQALREQIQRINQIILQMKAFARPAQMQVQRMSINEIVEHALAILRFDARLKRIRIEQDLIASAPAIDLMPQAMEQVLVNLIQNAIDAMEATAQPILTLRTRLTDTHCSIDVIDNGQGIQSADLGRVFEPFFTTKPVGKGTGLGLSISYSLIQKQNGSLSAHHVPTGGARFTISLPIESISAENNETPRSRDRETGAALISVSEKGSSRGF